MILSIVAEIVCRAQLTRLNVAVQRRVEPTAAPTQELLECCVVDRSTGCRVCFWAKSLRLYCDCVFRAKKVYVGGLLFYSAGMFLMAALKHKISVIVFSWTAGVMYSTLFTMPYLLVAHYHATDIVSQTKRNSSFSRVIAV